MRRSSLESVSLWQTGETPFLSVPLDRNIKTDVCVVGAGIAGLTTALLLQRENRHVTVVDAWNIGAGETGRTTAHLTDVLDDRFHNLEKIFGKENARLAAQSHKTAIDQIEILIREHAINCDFDRLDGYLAALTSDHVRELAQEKDACARVDLSPQLVEQVPLEHVTAGPALQFPRQGTFHIAKYMAGITRAFQDLGGQIYTNTRITGISGGNQPHADTSNKHRIDAKAIVVATNTPINDWVKMHTKQAAYRTYVVAWKIPKGSYMPFLLWDMEDPYHYARIVRDETQDYLVVGGEDHKTGQANDANLRYSRLEAWTRQHFSILGPIAYRWSGQVMEPVDRLGFIGRNPSEENVYIITGDSGNGMTHGTIGGILITDLIQGRENPWVELYDPARKTLQTASTYIKENANAVSCLISDWVAPGEVQNINDIPAGEGAIMRKGIAKIAVFKDEEGGLHECSATCPHLGCVVQWNGEEKSWDCPCHGSRFDTEGRILNGPTLKPLERAAYEQGAQAPQIKSRATGSSVNANS